MGSHAEYGSSTWAVGAGWGAALPTRQGRMAAALMIRIEIFPDRPARVRGFASGDPPNRVLSCQAGLKLTLFGPRPVSAK